MRRYAVLERCQEESELLLRLFGPQADHFEHLLLDVVLVDPDASAAQLHAVEHDIVSLRPDRAGIGVDQVPVLIHRHREGMVHCHESLLLVAPLKQRELDDPQEIELVVVDEAQLLAQFQAQRAEHVPHDLVLVRRDEQQVALLAVHPLDDRRDLLFRHELGKRALHAAVVLELDVRKALGAVSLGKSHQRVDLLAGHAALSLDVNTADGAVLHCGRICKDRKSAVLHKIRQVHQLHAEPGIGLVRAVIVHRVDPLHPLKRDLYVNVKSLLADILDQALIHVDNVVNIHEGKLHIRLRELGLPVRAKILVAEALRDLEVAVEAGAHEQLFEQLGRLGKRVEIAGMHAAGHKIVPRAFGRGLAQDRCLDLEESLACHELAHTLDHPAAQDQPSLHIGTAKVKASVF